MAVEKVYDVYYWSGHRISPSGRADCCKNGLGFARLFSGDTDRVEFPWPYDAEGQVNQAYDKVWLLNDVPEQEIDYVSPYLIDEAAWYLSPESEANMVSYSVVIHPANRSGGNDQNQTH